MASTRDFKSSPQGRSLVFETLVTLDHRGTPTPHLAKSWVVTDAGRSFTFDLRTDVTFHSGAALSADAVAYSLGLAAHSAGFGKYVEGVKVVGPGQVQLRLTRPYWPLLHELSFEHLARVVEPRSTTPGVDGARAFQGTGPFVLVAYEAGVGAELQPNQAYWGRRARIDRLVWITMVDPQAQIAALDDDRVDIIGAAEHHGALPYLAFHGFMQDARFETRFRSYGRHQTLDFNVTRPITGEIAVRHAVDAAIDRDDLVDSLFHGIPAAENTLSPPRPGWPLGPSSVGRPRYNPQRAEALLESAGWIHSESSEIRSRDGKPLELGLLVNRSESNAVAAANYIKGALGQIGFDVIIEAAAGTAVSGRLKSGDFDMHVSHTCSVAQLGCLSARGKYTRFNETTGLYTSPELAALLEDALGSAEGPQRAIAFDVLWRALDEHAVASPLFDVVKPMAHRSYVKGVEFGATLLTMDLAGVSVAARPGESCVD